MTSTRYFKQILFSFLLLLSAALVFLGCSKQPITKSGFYFDTIITVTLYDSSNDELLEDCFALADKYEKLFSATIESSDISRINQAGGEPVSVSDETIELLKMGLEYGNLSDGRFDITIGPLSSLWNFSENEGIIPSENEIATARSNVDYRNIKINGNDVTLHNTNAAIDLGGIAKGYIADKMKEYLNSKGQASGIINLGGNVLVLGEKKDGSPYTIGIQKPFSSDGTALFSVKVKDQTVVSSGVYERCFTVNDTLYHHILDVSTGYPYQNGLLGVTIICDSSADGDALSTTCFSLGLEKGMELIEALDNTEAVFITEDYKLHTSSGMGSAIPYEVY